MYHHSMDNCRKIHNYLKEYPHYSKLTIFERPLHVPIKTTIDKPDRTLQRPPQELSKQLSLQRAKTTITDLTICNEFDLFTTFTFKNSRQDIDKCKKRMSKWLNNQQKQYGKFKYIAVPEFHKDGTSLHFHILMKGYNGKLQLKLNKQGKPLTTRGKNQLYRILSWENGHSDASIIQQQNYGRVASYVSKYVTKDMPYISGGKRYWCSTGLERPVTDFNIDASPYHNSGQTDFHRYDNKLVLVSHDPLLRGQLVTIPNPGGTDIFETVEDDAKPGRGKTTGYLFAN